MKLDDNEEKLLRSVALQNAQAVFLARERAERELRESNERTSNILESITDAFLVLDKEWRCTHVNPQAEEILAPLKKSRMNLLGKSYWEEFPDLVGTALEKNFRRAVAEKVKVEFEIFYPPLGSWLQVRACPARDGLSVYFVDITERKQAERATQLLAAIVDSSDDAIVSKNLDGVITSWNKGAERIFGYSAEEAVGRHITLIIPDERRGEEADILARLKRGERVDHFQTVRVRKDGGILDVSLTISPMRDPSGRIVGASKVARDITAQRRAEAALRQSEEELRALADSIPQLAWMANPDGRVFWYNRGWYEYTGTTLEEMEGGGWEKIHDPDVLPLVLEKWAESVRSETPFEMEFPLRGADGVYRWFLTRVSPFRDPAGKVTRWFGTNTNIDEQRQLLRSLSEARDHLEKRVEERTGELKDANESLRALSARLLKIQDEERRRLARELHDSVGQILAALGMNVAIVQAQAHKLDAEGARAILENDLLVRQASSEIRTLSHLLHPPLLEIAGLLSAIRWYVEGFAERSKIKVDLDVPSNLGRLPDDTELAIFRIIQECLTNVHRHSESATAAIRIQQDGDRLTIRVEDSGKGIPRAKQREMTESNRGGVGIGGMRERIRQLGGTLEIRSNGKGTVITATLNHCIARPANEAVREMLAP
ncbi:MAG: PAS domain-containing sensor histidine kinase [Candidatus Sulfotelmatobacter sp.]